MAQVPEPIFGVDTYNLFPASPLNHVLQISKFPNLSFVVQEVNLPGVETETVKMPIPGITMHQMPNKIKFGALNATFLVDEDFKAYREIFSWLNGVSGGPDRSVLTAEFVDTQARYAWPDSTQLKTFGRASATHAGLTIVSGAKLPILRVLFYNVMPTTLGELKFSTTVTDNQTLKCDVSFDYDFFTIVDARN